MSGLEHLDCTGKLLTNNYGGYDKCMTVVLQVSFEHEVVDLMTDNRRSGLRGASFIEAEGKMIR